MKKRLFGDQLFEYRVKEGKGTKPGVLMTVEGVFQRGGVKNANDRVYPTDLWHKVLSQEDVKSRLENKQMYGQFGHPGDGTTDPMKISHVVTRQELRSDGVVWGEADVLDTPAGQVVATLFEAGSKLGISSRGDGSIESKGGTDEVQDDYRLETYDFVLRPSTPGAFPGLAESVEENEKLVAEAIEGLVKRTDIPDRVPVLAQCLDILSVLESRNSGDKVKMVVESIQEELGKKTLLEVSANPSINPLELLQQQESIMPYAGMTPVPAMPAGTPPVQDPNLLQWHQNQVNQAVHQVATQKENEVRGLKDTLIKAQREHQETKRKLAAAEELINEFTVKVKQIKEGITESEEYTTLATRYAAATDLLEAALEKLPEVGELRRRCEALEGLLQAGIEKFQEEHVSGAVEEALSRLPANLRESAKPMLESAVSVEQVAEMFKSLMTATGNKVVEHEPLPQGGGHRTRLNEGQGGSRPKKRSTVQSRLNHRLRNAVA